MEAVNGLLDRIRRHRGLFAIACLAVVALIAVGCGDDDDDDGGGGDSGSPESVEVTFPFQDSIVWAGYEIARDPGGIYETDYNLKPETVATEGGSFVVQQLIAGQIDYGITGTPETMIAAAQGHELVGIATIDSDIFTVVTTPDSGVSSIEDLEGQSLGVTDLGGGEIPLVNAVLDDAGLTPDENVELKVIGPGGPASAKAIQDGEVQAYAAAINDLAGIEATGVEFEPILDEKFQNLPNDQMVVRKELLEDEESLQTVLDVTKGMFEGTVFGQENPEEGLAIICELVPADCADMDVAQGFYDATLEGSIEQAKSGGAPDYDKLTTVRDAIAAADNPAAADINLEEVFPDTYSEDLTP
ncbi:MAG: transporter substrate-binding protein [Solirubrobacterales bacterium]|nr:transporter substrate-binding protein [Solirubrobacterales bacterium]